jgi:hypothetical protein
MPDITSPSNPLEDLVEREAPENSLASDIDQIDADISHKQFRFNPPLHNSSLSKVVDLGTTGLRTANFYDERTAPKDYTEKWAKEGLNTLRLGRIIQHHQAPGQVSQMQYRWGFRFLYNPTTVSYVSSRNDSFIIDPRSETNRVLSGVFQNFQSISFTVLLDRTPDVMSRIPDSGQYSPALRKGDRDGILRYGTHWDLEALLKICNGEWNLTDRGKTANMGVLMPSNARLILGPGINFYGFVGSVTWKDEMFSSDMVPIRTRLDIVFRRHVDMAAEDAEKSFPGIASTDTSSSSEEEGGGSYTSDTPGNPYSGPVPGYNKVTTPYGSKGSWWSSSHTGDDYGLGGIAGKKVVATRSGIVKYAGRYGGWGSWAGNHVIIKTGTVEHGYCHLQSIQTGLKSGQSISAGAALGRVGTTGNSSGNHLHYEERVNGKHRKPIWGNR